MSFLSGSVHRTSQKVQSVSLGNQQVFKKDVSISYLLVDLLRVTVLIEAWTDSICRWEQILHFVLLNRR